MLATETTQYFLRSSRCKHTSMQVISHSKKNNENIKVLYGQESKNSFMMQEQL